MHDIRCFLKRGGLALVLALIPFSAPAAEKILVFGTASAAPYVRTDGSGYLQRLYEALFAPLGYTVKIVMVPAERALINADRGIEDGDAMRIGGLETAYGNLVRIDEPVTRMDFIVFTSRKDLEVASWRDLGPYVTAFITGWKIAENNTGHVSQITRTSNPDQLFALLANGRADAAIFERWQGRAVLKKTGIAARVVEPPLASVDMYLYLNKRHAALVPALLDRLRALKADGTVARIAAEALQP